MAKAKKTKATTKATAKEPIEGVVEETAAVEAAVEAPVEAVEETTPVEEVVEAPVEAPVETTTTEEPEASVEEEPAVEPEVEAEHPTLTFAKDRIAYYIDGMAPNKQVTTQELVQLQMTFVNIIETLFRTDGEVFVSILDAIVGAVKENRSQFTLTLAYRGFEQIRQSPSRIRLAKQMLNLLITAADCKKLSDVNKHVNLSIFNDSIDGIQQELLASYFS